VGVNLKDTGRLFHSFGPTTEKARSPLVFSLDLGTINTSLRILLIPDVQITPFWFEQSSAKSELPQACLDHRLSI